MRESPDLPLRLGDLAGDQPVEASLEEGKLSLIVPPSAAGERLDKVAAGLMGSHSRKRLQDWIDAGFLTVDGLRRRRKDRLHGGETLALSLPPDALADLLQEQGGDAEGQDLAEPVPLEVVHEDEHIIVLDKPAGLVMHPAPGNRHGTVLNGLLHHDPSLARVPRAGIVHRLDKDTSGLCVVARTLEAHTHLVRQLQAREMGREYLAVVLGDPQLDGRIDAPIGRHPKDRKRMAVVRSGKPAITHFIVEERFDGCAQLAVRLETGRTHQIRVHLTHLGHALIGDPVYGRRRGALPSVLTDLPTVAAFERQALHARRLTLIHPGTGESITFKAANPPDITQLLAALRAAAC